MLIASQALLWLLVLCLSVAVLALARQVGVLHERIAPVGALAIGKGPQPGDDAPRVTARTLDGALMPIGDVQTSAALRMLFFVAPSCPVCKQLIPTARRFARSESIDLLFVGDGVSGELITMAQKHDIELAQFANSTETALAYHVGKLPYAVLISPGGKIISQGLVNTREHLESLLTVAETGVGSIQEYLRARAQARAVNEEMTNG
jgi:methylamine dehydrogenase accessory protein MauD